MAEIRETTNTISPMTHDEKLHHFETRLLIIEKKIMQAEIAYANFIKNAQDNPMLRMALNKFGITNDGTDG